MADTMAERFDTLKPHMTVYGPDDDLPRPAILLFHGCGGIRPHIHLYAETAVKNGVRAFVIDSLKPRGIGRTAAVSLVCTGAVLQGYERSGDVLSSLWGISNRPDVLSDQIILAGWSHGGWSIMDLMTQALTRSGDAKLKDPDAALIARIKGLFLVYPYINFPARSLSKPWLHKPQTTAVLATRDHLTSYKNAKAVFDRLSEDGLSLHTIGLKASHAFDEETFGKANPLTPMSYDADAVKASHEALTDLIDDLFPV
ncbi:MAG: dienelactone hydrolase [Asticcacaulis sp.]